MPLNAPVPPVVTYVPKKVVFLLRSGFSTVCVAQLPLVKRLIAVLKTPGAIPPTLPVSGNQIGEVAHDLLDDLASFDCWPATVGPGPSSLVDSDDMAGGVGDFEHLLDGDFCVLRLRTPSKLLLPMTGGGCRPDEHQLSMPECESGQPASKFASSHVPSPQAPSPLWEPLEVKARTLGMGVCGRTSRFRSVKMW